MSKDIEACLERVHRDVRELRDGEVASYIPELAKVDPELLAVAICTVDGEVVSTGDDRHELTLQSLSKPFVYGRALELLGPEAVRARLGVEPSGDAFDAIIRLDEQNRPHNPMVNAGAIAAAGLLVERGEGIADLLALMSRHAGRTLAGVDAPVYLSERTAGHRNRAIAHLMHHLGMLTAPVDRTLDLYFQQCSVLVNCRDLAAMAATLAAGGRSPLSGEPAIPETLVRHVLAVMFTCGFYDAAGHFAFEVGLPAKSGVCGGVLAVAPGRFGLAAFSPRLDPLGSSVRGTAAIAAVARDLKLHLLEPAAAVTQASSAKSPEKSNVETATLGAVLRSVHNELRGGTENASDARDRASWGGFGQPPFGAPADYLPQLAGDRFAIAACTVAGQEVQIGDAATPFSIQAVANPFGYGLAMEAVGVETVHQRVGREPSANPFNAIRFDPRTEKPFNPLGNAGAIAVCSLATGADAPGRLSALLDGFAAFAGAERMVIDAAVLEAEKAAGERNRAIASLLRNFRRVDDEEAALELYFQQCSINVTCVQLARMGATLANGGIQPTTGRRALAADLTRHVLSVMLTCGLHDESGRFAFDAGLPAKTGISGGIVAVVPGRMGLAVYSPAVNDHGSSVRGLAALEALSQRLNLSVFCPRPTTTGKLPAGNGTTSTRELPDDEER